MQKKVECVKVAVRCRPLSQDEIVDKRKKIVDVTQANGQIKLQNSKNDSDLERGFTFDIVFDTTAQQEQVYQDTALPIVESVLDGYNGTIFAYGQTGTGKTHTMEGRSEPTHERGIITRSFEHVFKVIEGTPGKQFLVRASYLELYNEEVRDLLSKNHLTKLELREKPDEGVYVKDLSRIIVKSVADLQTWLIQGRSNRMTGETKMNATSSRSHSIFTLTIESCETTVDNEQHITVGKLNLVDLAGSERQEKTNATGDRFKEAININQSLTTLGNVITALVDQKSKHIPYRDSKLTRLLQDSLGGNTKTVMIANIGPADYNFEETLSTLRYANRAKNIKNKPKINEDPKDAMIREFQDEIMRLKNELAKRLGGQVGSDGQIIPQNRIIQKEKVVLVEDEEALQAMQVKLKKEKEQIHKKADEERKQIEQEKTLAEDQKKDLLKKLEEKEKMQINIKRDEEKMHEKIKEMERQLLHGDKMKENSRNKEKELINARMELEERKQQERRLAEELVKKEAVQVDVESKYKSLQDEIDAKTKKLNQIVQKVKEAKQQTNEIHEYRQREKENLLEESRQQMQQLKLMNLIIEHFIPAEEVRKLELKLEFSEEVDDWMVKETNEEERIEKPGSALEQKRPLCDFSRMAINFGDQNPRFRPENILQLDLDLPERTTEEFDGNLSQKLQETMNIVLNEDDEELQMIQNEKQPNVYIEDPTLINKEAILNPQPDPKARLKSARKMVARRPTSGIKR